MTSQQEQEQTQTPTVELPELFTEEDWEELRKDLETDSSIILSDCAIPWKGYCVGTRQHSVFIIDSIKLNRMKEQNRFQPGVRSLGGKCVATGNKINTIAKCTKLPSFLDKFLTEAERKELSEYVPLSAEQRKEKAKASRKRKAEELKLKKAADTVAQKDEAVALHQQLKEVSDKLNVYLSQTTKEAPKKKAKRVKREKKVEAPVSSPIVDGELKAIAVTVPIIDLEEVQL